MRRGTIEEGGRTKEEGEMICGVRNGASPPNPLSKGRGGIGGAGVRWCGGARLPQGFRNPDVTLSRNYDITISRASDLA